MAYKETKIELINKYIDKAEDILEKSKFGLTQYETKDFYSNVRCACNLFDEDLPNFAENFVNSNDTYSDILYFIDSLKLLRSKLIDENEHDKQNTIVPCDNERKNKYPLIFLSHKSNDKEYGDALRDFIIGLGVKNDQLIYTSHQLHKIPIDVNIFEYLKSNMNKDIYMIFLWSNEYLESPACLNEMGAAWVLQSDYSNIYVPDFSFSNPKYYECAVDKNKMGIILNGDNGCRTAMIELKNKILRLFDLKVNEKEADYLLNNFIDKIKSIKK